MTYLQLVSLTRFLPKAVEQIVRVFGDVRVAAVPLEPEPDAPVEIHVVIDTNIEPERACTLLDELCDDWWDDAAASLPIKVHPVLGVLDGPDETQFWSTAPTGCIDEAIGSRASSLLGEPLPQAVSDHVERCLACSLERKAFERFVNDPTGEQQ